jgi:hypothetical protein
LKEQYNTDDNKNFGKKITHLSIPDQFFFLCAEPKRRRRRTGVSDWISSTVETNPRPPFTCSLGPPHQLLGQVLGKGNNWDLLGGTLVTMELKQFAADKSVLFVVGKARRWGHYQNEFGHVSNPFYAPI